MSSRPTFDPLDLAVMANAVAMIAEEMGTVLERGSLSPNIRERRDASSALFDAQGRMVAQAAHIPVHLGAMPEAVAAVLLKMAPLTLVEQAAFLVVAAVVVEALLALLLIPLAKAATAVQAAQ